MLVMPIFSFGQDTIPKENTLDPITISGYFIKIYNEEKHTSTYDSIYSDSLDFYPEIAGQQGIEGFILSNSNIYIIHSGCIDNTIRGWDIAISEDYIFQLDYEVPCDSIRRIKR